MQTRTLDELIRKHRERAGTWGGTTYFYTICVGNVISHHPCIFCMSSLESLNHEHFLPVCRNLFITFAFGYSQQGDKNH